MNLLQRLYSLELHNNSIFNNKICDIVTHNFAIIIYLDWALLLDLQTRFVKFVCKGIFIDLFKDPVSQAVGDLEGTANDFL